MIKREGIVRSEYPCPCGKGYIEEEEDYTPGHRDCMAFLNCKNCSQEYYIKWSESGLSWHLEKKASQTVMNLSNMSSNQFHRKEQPPMPRNRMAKLPPLLERKISKTGQTRGADDDVIYQNRVNRSGTVLIPFHQWVQDNELRQLANDQPFVNGFIVLISPSDYFSQNNPQNTLSDYSLVLGMNCLVFYETRYDWDSYNPENLGWTPANSREAPLGGQYVARVPATTAIDAERAQKINRGYATTSPKGAGIRLYEYASPETITACRLQLEAEYWLCSDAEIVASENGMSLEDATDRKNQILAQCSAQGLLDYDRLRDVRIINQQNHTICPLCLKELSGNEFLNRVQQPEGREVPDLTVTQVNLFHIDELKYGAFNHKPYNLGWGHHFCNVVVKDSGIYPTLMWMQSVLNANKEAGFVD